MTENYDITELGPYWKPGSMMLKVWYAMDKFGRIARLDNDSYGDLPNALKIKPNPIHPDEQLAELCDFIFGTSSLFTNYPENKNGKVLLDLFSIRLGDNNQEYADKTKKSLLLGIENSIQLPKTIEYAIANRGIFYYEGLAFCDRIKSNYPLANYDGKTKTGDYFRHLMPTIYGTIEDIPPPLRKIIAVSDTVDFTKDRLLDGDLMSEYFPRLYTE